MEGGGRGRGWGGLPEVLIGLGWVNGVNKANFAMNCPSLAPAVLSAVAPQQDQECPSLQPFFTTRMLCSLLLLRYFQTGHLLQSGLHYCQPVPGHCFCSVLPAHHFHIFCTSLEACDLFCGTVPPFSKPTSIYNSVSLLLVLMSIISWCFS